MEATHDATFLGEIEQLLESLDAGSEDTGLAPVADVIADPQPSLPSRDRRSRQREEIEYLRRHVHELEKELAGLQQCTGRAMATTTPTNDAWQRVAMRQIQAKHKAEAENIQLRGILQGQLKVAKRLEKFLRKRSSYPESTEAAAATKRLKATASASDAAIYDQLQQHLDAQYSEYESVFQANGFATARDDFEDVRVLGDDASGPITLELLHARVLPFDFASTSAALWKCSSMSSLQLPDGQYAPVQVVENQVRAKFDATVQVRRQYLTLRVHLVMKRYRDDKHQREVYVWKSFSKAVSGNKALDGIQAFDHGWTVVEALRCSIPDTSESAAGAEGASTIVRCCSRFVPDAQLLPRHQPIGTFSDFLIAHYNRNYATLFETVENILLSH